jgi:hypothetical protein
LKQPVDKFIGKPCTYQLYLVYDESQANFAVSLPGSWFGAERTIHQGV